MNDDLQITRDQIRSLLITLRAILPGVDWSRLSPDSREMVTLAVEEAEESIGTAATCEGGSCHL